MIITDNLWAIVLAAGEGSRWNAVSKSQPGKVIPKQFCSFGSSQSMLRWTLDRAQRLVSYKQIVTVVDKEHEECWKKELADFPIENILVQPQNRGVAAEILLPLIYILLQDPNAKVVVLPSDHYVEDEKILLRALKQANQTIQEWPNRLALLGVTPDEPEAKYGWIVPSSSREGITYRVAAFVEAPEYTAALHLAKQGALWNSHIFAATGTMLLRLYGQALPNLLRAFLRTLLISLESGYAGFHPLPLESLYKEIPTQDFFQELLKQVIENLEVLPVPACGWTDLGTSDKVVRYLNRHHPQLKHINRLSYCNVQDV